MPGAIPGTRDKDRACYKICGKAWNREPSFNCVQQYQWEGVISLLRGPSGLFLAQLCSPLLMQTKIW